MKQVLFILLVFISFQGFSQSVKVKEIGLEVMTKDLGIMKWEEAIKACENLGDGWRLPTIEELEKIYKFEQAPPYWDELEKIYKYKDIIGGFVYSLYWSSTVGANKAWTFSFNSGSAVYYYSSTYFYARAVRALK
jgi:hypothetical protein